MNNKPNNHNLHFGIDVGKQNLDIHYLENNKFWQIENKAAAIKQFLHDIKSNWKKPL